MNKKTTYYYQEIGLQTKWIYKLVDNHWYVWMNKKRYWQSCAAAPTDSKRRKRISKEQAFLELL